ncbi:hypothetical protein PybrP1_000445 [[Pythium] brassicae (nom. inval.)]|nr:hypothetical protein PybrP1_000445 [[Pythium] brassicae (nom. inval.)]
MKFWMAVAAPLLMLTVAAFSHAEAHSWLTKPVSRETAGATDASGTMGCPQTTPGPPDPPTPFKAGDSIDVRYWRNNHIGGFIRWSIVPAGSESHDLFDSNAFFYSCRESGVACRPSNDDKWAADGAEPNTIACGDKITLLDWPLWTWFGASGKNGNRNAAEATFRPCADIKLTAAGTKAAAPKYPVFVGGDRAIRIAGRDNDTCFYFHSRDIETSLFKDASVYDYTANYKFGVPSAVERCASSGGASNSTMVAPTSSITQKPTAEVGGDTDGGTTPAPTKKHCKAKRGRKRQRRACHESCVQTQAWWMSELM